jgi:hypothetical protein
MFAHIFEEVTSLSRPGPGLTKKFSLLSDKEYKIIYDPTKKSFIILIVTDPGRDIDDEAAIYVFIERLLEKCTKCNIHVIIVVKTGQDGLGRLLEFSMTPTGLGDLKMGTNIIKMASGVVHTIEILDGTKNLSDERTQLNPLIKPNLIISIAPGLDDVVTSENLEKCVAISHQGLLTGNALNDTKSMVMLEYIMQELKHINIILTTPKESFERLFSKLMFEKYKFPEILRKQIVYDTGNTLLGRMNCELLKLFVLAHAEGLINITYAEKINKPGTNARLIEMIRALYSGQIHNISPEEKELVRKLCIKYINTIIERGACEGRHDLIKQYTETIESLYTLTCRLLEMGLPALAPDKSRLLYSTDENIVNPEVFKLLQELGIFTPAYDLIAVEKAIELLQELGIFDL